MTDPAMADATYRTGQLEVGKKIIAKERPDAILPIWEDKLL